MGVFNCFNKFILIALNFVVFVFGIAIVALASMVIHTGQIYKDVLINEGILSLPIVVLIIGLLITLLGFFGCCGAMIENSCMLYTYATVVLILFLAGLVAGIFVLLYPKKTQDLLKKPLEKFFNKYGKRDDALDKVVDTIQHDYECCGINNSSFWRTTDFGEIPESCCKVNAKELCDRTFGSKDLFQDGCYKQITDEIGGISKILGIISIVLAIVQFLCICIACGLAKKRAEYV